MFASQMLDDREELRRRNAVSHRDDEDPVSLRRGSVKVEDGGRLKRVVVVVVVLLLSGSSVRL